MLRGRLAFGAVLLLGFPAFGQISSVSAGGGIPRPTPPAILTRPQGPSFGHHFRGTRFGTVLYPFSYYDDFYATRPVEIVEQPAPTPVVVLRDERPPAATSTPTPAPDPKLIEVPVSTVFIGGPAKNIPAVFILADGRHLEASNFTITDSLLTIKEPHRPAQQIPLSDLNIESTVSANHDRGIDLQFPESKSEILISF